MQKVTINFFFYRVSGTRLWNSGLHSLLFSTLTLTCILKLPERKIYTTAVKMRDCAGFFTCCTARCPAPRWAPKELWWTSRCRSRRGSTAACSRSIPANTCNSLPKHFLLVLDDYIIRGSVSFIPVWATRWSSSSDSSRPGLEPEIDKKQHMCFVLYLHINTITYEPTIDVNVRMEYRGQCQYVASAAALRPTCSHSELVNYGGSIKLCDF